jgi:LemA protein
MDVIWILLALAAVVVGYVIVTFNQLVSLRNRVREAWSDIQVQMKRRYDLIPNLVETVKGYAGHERGTLESVVKARGEAMANTGDPASQARRARRARRTCCSRRSGRCSRWSRTIRSSRRMRTSRRCRRT